MLAPGYHSVVVDTPALDSHFVVADNPAPGSHFVVVDTLVPGSHFVVVESHSVVDTPAPSHSVVDSLALDSRSAVDSLAPDGPIEQGSGKVQVGSQRLAAQTQLVVWLLRRKRAQTGPTK